MASRRYTVVIADRSTGILHRFTFSLRPTLLIVGIIFSLPILVGLGARWSVKAELDALHATSATLELENSSYRAATGELTTQIQSLQEAVHELGNQAALDPVSAKALAKLQGMLRSQGTGGGAEARPAARSVLAPALVSPEDTFGIVRDLLGKLEYSLQNARTTVEKRAALAAATPSSWPAYGRLSAFFGQRDDPLGDGRLLHTGLDISADKGQPVFATAAGIVQSTSYLGNYGNMVVIDHGYGMVTRYAHLSRFDVRPGDRVQRGQRIGAIGATGRTTGPHLHYELLINGVQQNPLRLLVEPARGGASPGAAGPTS